MFATLPKSKSSRLIFSALSSLILLAPAALANSADGQLIAQNSKYVQTYSFGKKTSSPQPKATSTKESTSTKASSDTKSSTTASSKTKKSKVAMIVGPKQYTSKGGNKWQKFADFINLKPGQEKLPLKFTILNGSGGTPPLRAIRATLSGRQLFTEKDFKGKRKLSISLDGAISSGATQIIFEAFGDAGSAFKWQISSSSLPVITGISPTKANTESTLTITGKNLPAEASAIKITVDKVIAHITKATTKNIVFKIPKKVKAGKDKIVSVSISGKKLKDFKIKIQGVPEITYMNVVGIGSQQSFNIKGKNFGDNAKDIEITFNGAKGIVSAAADDAISVVTPEIEQIPSVLSVVIKVDGVACKKPGKILGSSRYIPNNGTYSPFEVPAHLL